MPPFSVAIGVASAIVFAYAASLWWLLRRESSHALLCIALVCAVSLSLRLAYAGDYPAGLNDDEAKIISCAFAAAKDGDLLTVGCTDMPILLSALFQGQLVPLLGPGYWSIRLYALLTSVLATAAAFAAARALRFGTIAALAAGALVAVLPWSIFYGRVSVGGELVFHQLLLLAALARLIWAQRAGWPEIGIGGLGLTLLCFDYFAGLSMLATPLVAMLLARGRRLACLAIFLIATSGYATYVYTNPASFRHTILSRVHADTQSAPLDTIGRKLRSAVRVLYEPMGSDQALTIRSGAMHPPLVLGLAVIGVVVAWRRSVFLLAGFLIGVAPALASSGEIISSHRLLMAYSFIALAAAGALTIVRRPPWSAVVAGSFVVVIGFQSVRMYFSPAFWPDTSQAVFDRARTDLIAALPPRPLPRVVAMKQLGYFTRMRQLTYEEPATLSLENLLPPDHAESIYLFDPFVAPLRPFYEQLVGTQRVRAFGRAFMVSFEARQWSWMSQHGWAYQVRCGDAQRRMVVPVLYHEHLGFETFRCDHPMTHVWHGRWRGQAARLRLYVNGQATIDTPHATLTTPRGEQANSDFPVAPGDELRVTMIGPPHNPTTVARLMEVTTTSERVPRWESVDPVHEGASPPPRP